MALFKDVIMTVPCLHTLVSYNNLTLLYNLYQEPMCLYGGPGYPLRVHLQRLFANPTPDQPRYNKTVSKSRVAVEWVFRDISNFFALLDFKKNLKIGISSVGKM